MTPRPSAILSGVALGLTTDLYELTMASSYLRRGMVAPATFSLFARRLPRDRGFLVAAGLDAALQLLEQYRFDTEDLAWLEAHGFDSVTLQALADLRFTGDVWAVPEGRIVLADEPLVEITAPLPVAQLVETLVLNQLTFATALATKATRCRIAAEGRATLVDFSLRRTHGIEAGLAAARATAIAGFAGTSNVDAARRLGVPAVGTMAHSYVQAFPDERSAFIAFAEDFGDRTTFLVDTYDTLAGVQAAIDVAEELGFGGERLAVRLDSGDLLALSKATRQLLDDSGHDGATIVASGSLDEYGVQRLLDQGAPIDVFGVGTRVGVSADAPSLDTAYKLVEYDGHGVVKLSQGKETLPGPKQVYRFDGGDDLLATRDEPPPPDGHPLLVPVMRGGVRTADPEPVAAAADRLTGDLARLPPSACALSSPEQPPLRLSAQLTELTDRVRRDTQH